MEFIKYTSIENSYQTPFINKIRDAIAFGYIPKDMTWTVTEKVHGANFSILVTDDEQHQAKRTCLMADEDNFYGSQDIIAKHGPAFRRVYEYIKSCYGTQENPVVQVQCFGEIFGGQYPHPDVEKVKGAVMVQKGIWYCPSNEFYGFDIAYTLSDGTRRYVDQKDMWDAYTTTGILAAAPLFTGTFEECLKYPNMFPSTISTEVFGYPALPDNTCEGVVIKPEKDYRLANGDRPVVKNKNDKFKEKCHGPKVLREPEVLPEEMQRLLDTLLEYTCENRLCNVLSHDSYDMPNDFGRLIKDFTSDVMEDFVKDNHARWDLMEKADQKKLTKKMTGVASGVIKKHYRIG